MSAGVLLGFCIVALGGTLEGNPTALRALEREAAFVSWADEIDRSAMFSPSLIGFDEPVPNSVSDREFGVELEWKVPESCPGTDEIRTMIVTSIEEEGSAELELKVEGQIAFDSESNIYRLSLVIDGPGFSGQRSLENSNCLELTRAAALVIAMLVESFRPVEPEEEVEEPIPNELETEQTSSKAPSTLWGVVGIRGSFAVGSLPSIGPAVAVLGGLEGKRWRWEIGGQYELERSLQLDRGIEGLFSRATASSAGCVLTHGPGIGVGVDFPFCAGFDLGVVMGRAKENRELLARQDSAPWFDMFLEFRVHARLGSNWVIPVSVKGSFDPRIKRPAFHVNDEQGNPVLDYEIGRFDLYLSLGVERSFARR